MQAAHEPGTSWVSDDVWAELDPDAGRPAPGELRGVKLAAAATVLLIVAVVVFGWLGIWRPRIGVSGGSGTGARLGSHRLAITLDLMNNGPISERITAITGSTQLQVRSVTGLPTHLAAHTAVPVTVRVQILNCGATDEGSGSLYVQVDRPWGHLGKRLPLASLSSTISYACRPS